MKMAPEVDPRPDRVPEQELMSPPTRVSDGGVDLNRIWKNLSGALVLGHDE